MRLYWFLAALVLSALLASLQWWALKDFLYWYYVWFDVPMHFLGGVAIGTFLVGFWYRYTPVLFLGSMIAIGLGWEILEYLFGMPREANYILDTSIDLLMDTFGALTAYTVARLTLWRSR